MDSPRTGGETSHLSVEIGASSSLDTVALDRLRALAGGDVAFLSSMVENYLETTPPLLKKLRGSLENGDAAGVRMAAHTLKSGSAGLGAMALSVLCARLETLGREGGLEEAPALLEGAHADFSRVRAALEELLAAEVREAA